MRIAHLPAVYVSVAITMCQYWLEWGEGKSSNEHVWTGVQWWPPDVSNGEGVGTKPGPMSGGVGTVRSKTSWVMVTWDPPSPPLWADDACGHINFPQLRLRPVKMNSGCLKIKYILFTITRTLSSDENRAGSRRCSCSAPSWRRSCRSPGNLSRSPDWTRKWRRPPTAWTTTVKYTVIQASTHCVNYSSKIHSYTGVHPLRELQQ